MNMEIMLYMVTPFQNVIHCCSFVTMYVQNIAWLYIANQNVHCARNHFFLWTFISLFALITYYLTEMDFLIICLFSYVFT